MGQSGGSLVPMAGLDQLSERLERLEELTVTLAALADERAVVATLEAYAHAIDYGDDAAWIACFTDDGVFDMRSRQSDQLNAVVAGRDQLRQFIEGYGRAPEYRHQHLVLAPRIEIEGDRATAQSYFLIICEHEDEPVVRVFGRYRDDLIRGEDRVWRLQRRVAESDCWRSGLAQYVGARARPS